MTELSKTYSPQDVEEKWYSKWKNEGYFKAKEGKQKKPFSIIMPPPNVTGKLHMGHALDHTAQDVLIRYKRMKGFETRWIPGCDHAGIATQSVVEKKLWQENKKTRHDIGRDKFLEMVWDWKNTHGDLIVKQLEKIGVSPDWDQFLFTMDPLPNKAVRKVFTDWFNQGLIYQSDYIVNWDPVLQSAISDAEVEHQEVKGAFYHITYKVKDSNTLLEVATTRPETLLGDTAVAVNPNDERFKDLIGKKAIVPVVNREVPIIGDDHVDIEVGTGCLKVTPGHDFNDFEIGRRHKLEIVNIINPDGTLNEVAPDYQGLTCKAARKKILEALTEMGQFIKEEKCVHQVGHGQRSGSIVEPIVSKQWFVNVKKMAADAVEAVEKEDMKFFPKSWENTYFSWLREPRDWCISRQLWWGHRIPVFYCDDCNHQWASENDETVCTKCSSKNIRQDDDVLDTWFSSGLWPLTTLGWPDKKLMEEKEFEKFFPSSVLVTAFDIIFFWVARMMMMTTQVSGKSPFAHTYIHAIVRDKQGRKMSKSLGNGIDPIDIIAQYGSDAMRFTLAAGSGYNRNLNLDPERIEGYRNFINKLWNAFRFIAPFINDSSEDLPEKLTHHDRWIISELNAITKSMNNSLDEYRFDDACTTVYSFVYDKFCSWYIELSKNVLYSENEEAKTHRATVLRYTFKKILALLHPIIPFISEELWAQLKTDQEDLLIVQDYPEYDEQLDFTDDQNQMNKFIEVISGIRNLRQSVNIKPKDEVAVQLFTDDQQLANYFNENQTNFAELAKATNVMVKTKASDRPTKSISSATTHTEIFIPLEGIIDLADQIKRIEKNIQKVEKELSKFTGKLSNKKFTDRAPAEVIADTKMKADELSEQLSSLTKMKESFSA